MRLERGIWVQAALAAWLVWPAAAQFEVAGKKVQVHGFFSQGYALSDTNNYMTMNTSQGSLALTDGGVNISTKLTNKLRVGMQAYTRNMGQFTNGKPEIDWAYADYRITDWLGVRGGKVKTVIGLYNDTQDMEFLHTWAILPQSLYALDLRALNIAHVGGDLYGDVPLRKLGTVSYTVYGGRQPDDKRGGYYYGLADSKLAIDRFQVWAKGADVRWMPAQGGLTVGASWNDQRQEGSARDLRFGRPVPFEFFSRKNNTYRGYAEYQGRGLKFAAEYQRLWAVQKYSLPFIPEGSFDSRSWYVSGAYRIHRVLEAGSYHARYVTDWRKDHRPPGAHVYDTAVTVRVDVKPYWNVKVEGHFLDGYASLQSTRGFYARNNPQGLVPRTNLLVLRTGVNF
ncbi:MAG: hypothetical protein J0L64_13285 [Acidobacteria bacterium]|nr:hypothetical protein [Acidobacteriota bacterium]